MRAISLPAALFAELAITLLCLAPLLVIHLGSAGETDLRLLGVFFIALFTLMHRGLIQLLWGGRSPPRAKGGGQE